MLNFKVVSTKTTLTVVSVLILLSLIIPTSTSAQNITFPSQAEGTVSVSEMTELARLMAYARSATLLAYFDALEQTLPPLVDAVRGVLGDETPSLPDISGMRKDYIARLDSVALAPTIADAEAIINGLETEARRIQGILEQIPGQLMPLATILQERGMGTKDEITRIIEAEISDQVAVLTDELTIYANQRATEFQARIQAEIDSLTAQITAQAMVSMTACKDVIDCQSGFNPDAMVAEFQVRLNAMVADFTSQLTDEMNLAGKQKESELRAWIEQRVEELKEEKAGPYLRIQNDFEDVNGQISAIVTERQAFYESYYQQFKDRKIVIIKKAMEPQLQAAIAQIKQYGPDLALAQKEGRGLPTEQQLLDELQTGWEELVRTITSAEYSEDIDQAITSFKALWQEKQSQLEYARTKGAQEVINTTLQKVKEKNTETQLATGRSQSLSYISQLENTQKKVPLSQRGIDYLLRCRQLLPQMDEAVQLIAQFKQAKPTDDLKTLLEMKDRLQSKLENIQQVVSQISSFPGDRIFIEAENESFTSLYRRTESWHSVKESNPKPTWRPEPSGWADWYLSRGGELLGYYVKITEPGAYTIWIRDMASTDHPAGRRAITVRVDGTSYGIFPEHTNPKPYPKGIYGWHATATVTLAAGQHRIELIKTETTSAAAIIDAIYLTNNPKEVPK